MPANVTIWNAPVPDPNYDRHQAERTAIFNKIAPKDNWKGFIDAWIAVEDFDDCAEAAKFFTGSILVQASGVKDGKVRVTAPGYYEAVGA